MQSIVPKSRDLVLIGGGHTHALVLRKWGMSSIPDVRLTVIDPTPVTAYSGMLPGYVAGHYAFADLEIDLIKLTRFAGARFIIGPATHLDPEKKVITVPGRAPISYDIASVDIGITSRMPALAGFADHSVPAKPLGHFATRWAAFVSEVNKGVKPPHVAIIGGGIAGVELALTMHHRLATVTNRPCAFSVIDRSKALAGVNARSEQRLRKRLQSAGITVVEDAEIIEVTAAGVRLSSGQDVTAAFVVGAAGATPAPWLANSGLAHESGFIVVDRHLRSPSHPSVFAAGDCAHFIASPHPKAGVFAVRAAPVLDHNLRALIRGKSMRRFRPQKSYLKLVSLGPKDALAQKGPVSLAGPRMWQWKDHIDRSFMKKLQNLPTMTHGRAVREFAVAQKTPRSENQPLCGGCGSKVGPGALSSALATLPEQNGSGVVTGPGDDAAVFQFGDQWQVISTDHLRAIVDDPETMARIALYHAMGDVWAMGATPQSALAQIILPRMSEPLQSRALVEITDTVAACATDIGAALAGGHTTMGAELTLGFTVTGLRGRPPITKSGAQPGDILLLTRPIGSGTLLAAEMQMKARGRWIAELLQVLTTHQGKEAAILAEGAHAMTDVTGFGLAGHALEIARASGVGVALDFKDVPLFEGAAELAASGIRSTIFNANENACRAFVAGKHTVEETALLYDPQTGGGLLAALPPQAAIEATAQIAKTGGRAWTVGQITDGPIGLAVQ